MESRAKALGHPIHQMLIPFPFGLLATAVIFDIIYLFVSNPATADTLSTVAFWMIAAGIVGGLVAAPFGLIDYLAIPSGTPDDSRARHGPGRLPAGGRDGLARRRTRRPPRRRRGRRRAPRRAQLAHHQLGARRRARERAVKQSADGSRQSAVAPRYGR